MKDSAMVLFDKAAAAAGEWEGQGRTQRRGGKRVEEIY